MAHTKIAQNKTQLISSSLSRPRIESDTKQMITTPSRCANQCQFTEDRYQKPYTNIVINMQLTTNSNMCCAVMACTTEQVQTLYKDCHPQVQVLGSFLVSERKSAHQKALTQPRNYYLDTINLLVQKLVSYLGFRTHQLNMAPKSTKVIASNHVCMFIVHSCTASSLSHKCGYCIPAQSNHNDHKQGAHNEHILNNTKLACHGRYHASNVTSACLYLTR